ncbi:MAG: DUF4886 domain-containing protein [Oscillospiraceae bacterium]|nr:DUF4886 domain-containing protein [Oscillospiraceae bacterium]
MKHTMFSKVLSALLALVLCLGMVPATAMPAAAAANLGSKEWVARNDDFSGYPVGTDTFYGNAKYNGFGESSHGTYGGESYATYGIIEENGNKMLELVSVNKTGTYFNGPRVSGAHSVTMDVYMPRSTGGSVPGLVLSLFDGLQPSLPGSLLVYIDGGYDIRLVESISTASTTKANVTTTMQKADGNRMALELDSWHTVKMSVEPGKFVVKVWKQGEQEPADNAGAGVCVFENAVFSESMLNGSMMARIQSRARNQAGVAYKVRIDNLKVTKPYESVTLPKMLYGDPGERLTVDAVFTGQDLAAQMPAPKFSYTFSNPALGSASGNGDLILGKEGQGTLTIELADMDGKGTGVTHTAKLVVGGNAVFKFKDALVKVPETDIGKTYKLETVTQYDLNLAIPGHSITWLSNNETVATVDQTGVVTLKDFGTAKITAMVKDSAGNDVGLIASCKVQVGEEPLRILSIGNSYSRDTFYYLSHLAKLVGKRVEAGYLMLGSATLRMHARNVAKNAAEYSYYKSNPMTGEMLGSSGMSSINETVLSQDWDVIMLQQGVEESGVYTTFNADLQFLLDYLADVQPNAKVYWNMTWANQADTKERRADFDHLFDGNQNVMYNAIVECLGRFIVGKDAEYADDFDGWFPVGAAIQNVRATAIGDKLTRDGYHLSLQAGRLTAAMTALKVLFPDADLSKITPEAIKPFLDTDKKDLSTSFPDDPNYANTEANLALIRQSVEAACKDLTKVPAKLKVPTPRTVENTTPETDDVTVGQVTAPMGLHFGDLVVDKAGVIYTTAYECICHVPTRNTGDYKQDGKEGAGILQIWKSTDNGKTWDYDHPLLTIDQRKYEEWGIVPDMYNRYEKVSNGADDYTYFFDGRDPNMGIMYYDMDGNGTEDEVLLYTFWGFQFLESGASNSEGTYLMYSIDGGENWTVPQRVTTQHCPGNGGIKRGDITYFSNGQILVPLYGTPTVVALLLQWDVATQKWVTLSDVVIPNFVPEKGAEMNECSFVAPDPNGDYVEGFVRSNGQVVASHDRGRTWEHIHTIAYNVQQPGWAYIDENRAFATWAFLEGYVRPTKGQMVYFDAGWEATQPAVIHNHYYTGEHDNGDPSSKLLADGRILSIMYDDYFRSIVGKFVDPNDSAFLLPEMDPKAGQITVKEVAGGANVTIGDDLPFAHTLNTTATFAANGKLTVNAANGAVVEFAVGQYGIEAGKATELRVAITNGATYLKAWPVGGTEPAEWTFVQGGTDQISGKAVLTASGVEMGTVKVTRRATITMNKGGETESGKGAVAGVINPAELNNKATWTSSNPKIATVDGEGNVFFVGSGTVTITGEIAGATGSVTYNVKSAPAEVIGRGEKKVIFQDNYESYTVGENTFYNEMSGKGYVGIESQAPVAGVSYYNVEQEGNNKYLKLVARNSKQVWFKVNTPITGDYTVQFDYRNTDGNMDRWMYVTLWQDTDVYGFVQMRGDNFRFQYKDKDGVNTNSDTFYAYDAAVWNTMKIARVNGAVYVKVWPRGTQEPAGWQYSVHADTLPTDVESYFRISFYSKLNEDHVTLLDNLIITQQQVSGADAMTDVGSGDWYYDAVDYVINNKIMSGYNASTFGPNDTLNRAMVVQVLYNKEGQPALNGAKHNFKDVPGTEWYNNAVTWGSNKGVVSGYGGGVFKPNDAVSLEQVAVILHNYAGKPAGNGDISKFGACSDWAQPALKWAAQKGLFDGMEYGSVTASATRAQTAQMLTNYLSGN